jgi:hypothetical protein
VWQADDLQGRVSTLEAENTDLSKRADDLGKAHRELKQEGEKVGEEHRIYAWYTSGVKRCKNRARGCAADEPSWHCDFCALHSGMTHPKPSSNERKHQPPAATVTTKGTNRVRERPLGAAINHVFMLCFAQC